MGTYPPGWRNYVNDLQRRGVALDRDLGRFAARYRMARKFRSVQFDGVSTGTADGYSAAMSLGLAYSTLEALERALRVESSRRLPLVDAHLAAVLRGARLERFRMTLLEPPMAKLLEQRLHALLQGKSDDVRPVVERLRHALFHGTFTPHGAGLTDSVAIRTFVTDLADAVLTLTEVEFAATYQGR